MKLFNELTAVLTNKVDELVTQLVLSNKGADLLDKWDSVMDILDKAIEEFDAIEGDPTSKDYIKLSSAYLLFAILKLLEEKE